MAEAQSQARICDVCATLKETARYCGFCGANICDQCRPMIHDRGVAAGLSMLMATRRAIAWVGNWLH